MLGSWSSLGTDIAFASERGTKSNLPVTKDGQGFKIGLKLTRFTSVFDASVASTEESFDQPELASV